MTETASAASERSGAGAMLRAAREKHGLHPVALAAALKVQPRMIEALESDRLHELPDLAFARALAQAMCRHLRVDAAPVLALLPRAGGDPQHLEQVSTGLATPFQDRPGQRAPGTLPLGKPVLWATGLVLLAAIVVALWPELGAGPSAVRVSPAASAASAAEPAASTTLFAPPGAGIARTAATPASALVETVHSAPPPDAPASAPVATGPLVLRAHRESWIEAVDAGGQVLLSRSLQPGETLSLDGALPLKLRIGNVAGTSVSFRGAPIDIQSMTRDNTVRLELK